jgi:hypothetical protein
VVSCAVARDDFGIRASVSVTWHSEIVWHAAFRDGASDLLETDYSYLWYCDLGYQDLDLDQKTWKGMLDHYIVQARYGVIATKSVVEDPGSHSQVRNYS